MTFSFESVPPIPAVRRLYHSGRYKKVASRLKPGSLLDIGCGRPCETMPDMAFLRYAGRPDSSGLDILPLEGPFPFKTGSILDIPFPDASFDNVVAMEVIEHVSDMEKALKEVRRVLKPGGVFVMSTPDCNAVWNAAWALWTHLVGRMWHHTHLLSLHPADLSLMLAGNFTEIRWTRHWYFDMIFDCRKPGA